MTQKEALSLSQMAAVLDNAPVAVLVSALDNRELLYMNLPAQELVPFKPSGSGATCYSVFGLSSPCPHCPIERLSRSSLYSRELSPPDGKRTYRLSGKIIDWGERPAHIEYILDVTESKRKESQAQAVKEELQSTFASIPCGLCVYKLEGERILPLFHNPAFFRIMGFSEAHIRQVEAEMRFTNVHPEDLPALKASVAELIQNGGVLRSALRVFNDLKGEYRYIQLEGSMRRREDGATLLYAVYSDVSERVRLEKELAGAYEKMEDIVNAIPGGVAIYKVTDIFETVYFSDGVPELSGYTVEEYRELTRQDAARMTYQEDTPMVVAKAMEVIKTHRVADFEFRKQHRDGHIVWVRAQVKWIGEAEGCPLLHCVFHNITDLKEAQLEMGHLVNSIPGGIASYRVEGERFIPTYYSDGVLDLTGHTREEYDSMLKDDALLIVYEPDRARVLAAAQAALLSGEVLDVSYRILHKDGSLVWVHLNGRRMGPLSEATRFYAVFTGMSSETRLFQSIANEMADGFYVIGKENYDLLYANESKSLFLKGARCVGQKCYAALHGQDGPCPFCTLKSHAPDGQEHEMPIHGKDGRFYATRFRETDWNGIPAYVKYVRDITEEVVTRREKARLEQYFQTILRYLPGGVAVVRCREDGGMAPEFLSEGFAGMTGMTLEEAWDLYREDATAGVHPEDCESTAAQMDAYIQSGASQCELVYRLLKGDGGYVWVKNTLSLIESEGGERRVYAVYHDMTAERQEQARIRQQYQDLILQHYRTPEPNALVIGHCNITKNRILEIIDHTDSQLLQTFGTERETFFTGLSTLLVDPGERQAFLQTYLNGPSLAAFARNEVELLQKCFIQLPKEAHGRYVQFKVNLVEAPGTGDITGILTVTDITEQTISDRILHQLTVTSYDFVIDLNLAQDSYVILARNQASNTNPPPRGSHSKHLAEMAQTTVVPKDREQYAKALDPAEIRRRLQATGPYTFSFSITDEKGDIRTKNMTVSAVDLRLGRVCLVRTDITDSVREQQGLLNMIAYTFDLAGFIDTGSGRFTMYTRQTVLQNLAPYVIDQYDSLVEGFTGNYGSPDIQEEVRNQFRLETMLAKLAQRPAGYDFVLPYHDAKLGERYKQINVLWGDVNHRTVCIVRADVTDMLAAERQTKKRLENALALAEQASKAKSDFLSHMSHDIRTPMNAIIGMTTLARAHIDEPERVKDSLQKIAASSKHLLSLINDILEMSKIERSKITLNRVKISLPALMEQLAAMLGPQAKQAGLQFAIEAGGVRRTVFYGDSLRISQILINILSNAVKFTPAEGKIDFLVEERPPKGPAAERVRYRFTIRDTGIGMPEEVLCHIFEPFTRSGNAERIEGTGLGLSITKGLVDLMGGEISVESQVGRGSVFRVELEFDAAAGEAAPQEALPQAPAGPDKASLFAGRLFLVAEDNAINAEILCELLAMYGAETCVTEDGARAVEVFQNAPPGTYDAILMDIQMPRMNGYEATRAIRRLRRDDARAIPIVAMSANAFSEDVQASLACGMTAHVAKPIDLEVLQATLSKALGGTEKP